MPNFNTLPKKAQWVGIIVLISSIFALGIGVFGLLKTHNLISYSAYSDPNGGIIDPDDPLLLEYFIRFLGTILTIAGTIGIIFAMLFLYKRKIGWILIFGSICAFILGLCYLLVITIQVMTEYSLLSIPVLLIIPFMGGIILMYILLLKEVRSAYFKKQKLTVKV